MKTLFICSSRRLEDHGGESYDDFTEVRDDITTEGINEETMRIRNLIRKLWNEDSDSEDQGVSVTYDAIPVYRAMLINLHHLMADEEGIDVVLDWYEGPSEVTDPEAREALGLN